MRTVPFVFFWFALASHLFAQTSLTPRQIAAGEALGRTTFHSLKFGIFASVKGDDLGAFVLSPVQRIAYAISEEANTHHRDVLKDELHLNRLRVDAVPYGQHHSRNIVLYDNTGQKSLKAEHLVLDLDQAIGEFAMPGVIALAGTSGKIFIQITDETGIAHSKIPFDLKSINKQYPKLENEFFK